MKKSFSGIKGSVATIASSPTRQTEARSKPGGTSFAPSRNPRAPAMIEFR